MFVKNKTNHFFIQMQSMIKEINVKLCHCEFMKPHFPIKLYTLDF